MIELGLFFFWKLVNCLDVFRKIGISKICLSELMNNVSMKLWVDELYLIVLVIDVDFCEVLKEVCKVLEFI